MPRYTIDATQRAPEMWVGINRFTNERASTVVLWFCLYLIYTQIQIYVHTHYRSVAWFVFPALLKIDLQVFASASAYAYAMPFFTRGNSNQDPTATTTTTAGIPACMTSHQHPPHSPHLGAGRGRGYGVNQSFPVPLLRS